MSPALRIPAALALPVILLLPACPQKTGEITIPPSLSEICGKRTQLRPIAREVRETLVYFWNKHVSYYWDDPLAIKAYLDIPTASECKRLVSFFERIVPAEGRGTLWQYLNRAGKDFDAASVAHRVQPVRVCYDKSDREIDEKAADPKDCVTVNRSRPGLDDLLIEGPALRQAAQFLEKACQVENLRKLPASLKATKTELENALYGMNATFSPEKTQRADDACADIGMVVALQVGRPAVSESSVRPPEAGAPASAEAPTNGPRPGAPAAR